MKPLDNLNIKGIADETTRPGKKRRGRKVFGIQTRWVKTRGYRETGLGFLFNREWYTHSRYTTESARDQAHAALVKKADREYRMGWFQQEYRKVEFGGKGVVYLIDGTQKIRLIP